MENKNMSAIGGSASGGKKTITILLVLIIGIAVGFVGGRYYKSKSSSNKIADSGCEAKLEKAKTMFPSMLEMKSVSGKIKEIKEKTIVLEAIGINPLEDLPVTREITIGENTKIVKSESKDQAAFQKEMEEYQKIISTQTDKPQSPPIPFSEKEVSLVDLKIGDQVLIEASENIKDKTSFEAVKITLQIMPAVPTSTSAVPPTNTPIVPPTIPSVSK